MKIPLTLVLLLVQSSACFAITAIFKDGLDLNGNPISGMPPQPYSTSSSFPAGSNTIVTDFVYRDGSLADPSGYRALSVGHTYSNPLLSRSVLDFDLSLLTSSLSPAPSGSSYVITSLELILEVSGNHPSAPDLGFHLGDQAFGNPLLGTPIATQTGYTVSTSFVGVNLPISSLGTITPTGLSSNYVVTVASTSEGDGRYVNLGSSIGPNTWSSDGAGSGYYTPGPELRIEYEVVRAAITPEPSRVLLLAFSFLVLGQTRRR